MTRFEEIKAHYERVYRDGDYAAFETYLADLIEYVEAAEALRDEEIDWQIATSRFETIRAKLGLK